MTIDKQKLQKLLWAEAASYRADCADWKRNTEALQEFLGEKTAEEVALELLAENERLTAFEEAYATACNGLAAGSAGAKSSNLGASSAGYSSNYFLQALGGAWSSGVQMFANGGAFTNSVVSTPTAFGMAGGRAGVMGEAGPEAIMPLTRTSSGKLGVLAAGGGSGTAISISVPVTVVTQDRGSEGMQIDQQALSRNLQSQMQAVAEKAVADSWRAGGTSFRNANGRA